MVKRDPKAPVTIKMLNDAVDTILMGIQSMFDIQNKRIDQWFDRLDRHHPLVD